MRPEREGFENWIDVLSKLGTRRGNPSWVHSFVLSMKAKGKTLGIDLDFGGQVGNSLDSLRVLKHVQKECGSALSEEFADLLAEMHFEKRQCVCKHENILKAALAIGCSEEKVKRVLKNKTLHRSDVLNEIDLLHRMGIYSIPFFQLTMRTKDKSAVRTHHGASSVQEFYESFKNMKRELMKKEE